MMDKSVYINALHMHFPGKKDDDILDPKSPLALIIRQQQHIIHVMQEVKQMATAQQDAIDRLTAEVAQSRTVMASAAALIRGFKQQIQDAVAAALAANPGVDLTALTALADGLDSSEQDLAQAVTENTPAAPGGDQSGEGAPAPAPAPAGDTSGTDQPTTGSGDTSTTTTITTPDSGGTDNGSVKLNPI